ncbi:MAG: hypothetical protein V3R86_04915 [Candidatus Hydrothermarchaeaceae archaeon]
MKKILALCIILAAGIGAVYGSEGGGDETPTKYYDISIHGEKKIFTPGGDFVVEATVIDKLSKKPVDDARVTADVMMYLGGKKEKIQENLPQGDGYIVIEQKRIQKKVEGIKAQNQGDGVYMIKTKLDTEADIGGITLTLTVEKDNKIDTVTQVVSFMRYNVFLYAIIVTLGAMAIGAGVGIAFGGVSH